MVGVGEYIFTGQLSFYHWVESGIGKFVIYHWVDVEEYLFRGHLLILAVVGYGYRQLLIIGEGWESTLLYVSFLSVGRVGGYSFY